MREIIQSERGTLRTFPWEFGDGIEFFYTEDPEPAGAGIDPGLHTVRQRMWELVALGVFLDGFPARDLIGRTAHTYEDIEPWVLRALASQLTKQEPGWELVAQMEVVFKRDLEVCAARCGLPIEVVAASAARLNKTVP